MMFFQASREPRFAKLFKKVHKTKQRVFKLYLNVYSNLSAAMPAVVRANGGSSACFNKKYDCIIVHTSAFFLPFMHPGSRLSQTS